MSVGYEANFPSESSRLNPSEEWLYAILKHIWDHPTRTPEEKAGMIGEKCATALVDPDVGLSFNEIEAIREKVMKGE